MSARESGFSRSHRLTKATEYRQVFNNSRRFSDQNFLLLTRKNRLGPARLGLAISKKKIPLAVHRNRVKRLLRDSFRRHKAQLRGMDIVILARRDISSMKGKELRASLEETWHKMAQCESS